MCRFLVRSSPLEQTQLYINPIQKTLTTPPQVYKGSTPILLSSLILTPTHSILTQSYDSRLRLDHRRPHNGDGFGIGYHTTAQPQDARRPPAHRRPHNGDGFGIGYYTTDPALGRDPCVFKSTLPAW